MRLKFTLVIFSLFALISFSKAEKKISMLHACKIHSSTEGFSPESSCTPLTVNDDDTVGGFNLITTIIRKVKKKLEGSIPGTDCADFFREILFQTIEVKEGFQTDLRVEMGHGIGCYGKNRFDSGQDKLFSIFRVLLSQDYGTNINVDSSKKNNTFYSGTANSYMPELIGMIKKISFGLINSIPIDAVDKLAANMKSDVIDMDENKSGVEKGKERLALARYLPEMKDLNGNGIPDLIINIPGLRDVFYC